MFIKKTVKSIIRVGFDYNSLMTYGYLCKSSILFPVKPTTFFKQLFDFFIVSRGFLKVKDELGILNSHDEFSLNQSEVMLAVGLGRGISLIHNAKIFGRYNSITVIEASIDVINECKKNLKLNNIFENKINIINGFVGNPTNVYTSTITNSTLIDINNIEFDVLELDCEGSEIEILDKLTSRPRHIIVEMHPMNRDIDFDQFLHNLISKGYYLAKAYKVDGSIVPLEKLGSFFTKEFVSNLNLLNEDSNQWRSSLLVLNFLRESIL